MFQWHFQFGCSHSLPLDWGWVLEDGGLQAAETGAHTVAARLVVIALQAAGDGKASKQGLKMGNTMQSTWPLDSSQQGGPAFKNPLHRVLCLKLLPVIPQESRLRKRECKMTKRILLWFSDRRNDKRMEVWGARNESNYFSWWMAQKDLPKQSPPPPSPLWEWKKKPRNFYYLKVRLRCGGAINVIISETFQLREGRAGQDRPSFPKNSECNGKSKPRLCNPRS